MFESQPRLRGLMRCVAREGYRFPRCNSILRAIGQPSRVRSLCSLAEAALDLRCSLQLSDNFMASDYRSPESRQNPERKKKPSDYEPWLGAFMGGLTPLRVVAIRNRRVPTALKVNQRACGKPALIPAQAKAEDGTYVPISTRVAQCKKCKSCDDGEPVGRALLPTFDVSGPSGP